MSERAAPGLSLGTGVAVVVVAAAVLPIGLLVRERFLVDAVAPTPATPAPASSSAPASSVDAAALQASIVALEARARDLDVERAELRQRAENGDRGERLRQLGRAIATTRDARRASGMSGAQLRSPFPLAELDVGFLALSKTRWLTTRDGTVVAPANTTSPVSLATTGRDEEPLTVDATIDGQPVKLARRCVAFEGFCVVDVEAPAPVTPSLDLAPLKAAMTTTTTTKPEAPPPAPAPSLEPAPKTPAALVLVVIGLSMALLVVSVSRLRELGSSITRASLRLRAGLVGRASSAPPALSSEVAALERSIDDAFAAVAAKDGGVARDRLADVAASLDAARHGVGERVERVAADDVVTAAIVDNANALLDAIDERARRWSRLLGEVSHHEALPGLAERLLRLARLPGLPANLVDELSSLGSAVAAAQKTPADAALQTLRDDVARVTPAAGSAAERLATVAALRDLPPADVARLTAPESPSDLPRPSE